MNRFLALLLAWARDLCLLLAAAASACILVLAAITAASVFNLHTGIAVFVIAAVFVLTALAAWLESGS